MKIKYLTYAYLLILLLGSVLPINSGSSVLNDSYTLHIRWDYLLHALIYIPLPVLLGLLVRRFGKSWPRILIILNSVLLSAFLELVQMVLPYRAFNINDLVANGAGVALGSFVVLILLHKSRRRLVDR